MRQLAGLLLLALASFATPAAAQTYGPVLFVNDKAISAYELAQRIRLLEVLGTTGDLEEEAREGLIDDRLRLQAAEAAGLVATDEALQGGVAEFAERSNQTPEAFLGVLAGAGIDRQTFLDFVEANILWRELIQTRFGPRTQVTDAEIDRALGLAGGTGAARVLLSEVLLPARSPEEEARAREVLEEVRRLPTASAFAAAARQFSASPSRANGGDIDWVPLGNLPPDLRRQVLTLAPGRTTEIIEIPNAVGVFRIRAFDDRASTGAEVVAIDYAEYRIPGGSAEDAARVAAEIDTCDDLYGVARDMPEDRLLRDTRPVAEIPADTRAALDTLDQNEVSIAVRRGPVQVLVMLCGRVTAVTADVERGDIRRQLVAQRLAGYSESYLSELRADATISEPR